MQNKCFLNISTHLSFFFFFFWMRVCQLLMLYFHVLGIVQISQSHIGDLCIKRKKATTRLSLIGYQSEGSTVGWYFGIGQDSGKILHTCKRLIIDQWILESGDLKFTRWGFCLAKGFPHLSTNHCVNLISTAFSLFGNLLVPP